MSNFEKDLKFIEDSIAAEKFDWFAFRCEVAERCLPAIVEPLVDGRNFPSPEVVAKKAVVYADALIEELKKIE